MTLFLWFRWIDHGLGALFACAHLFYLAFRLLSLPRKIHSILSGAPSRAHSAHLFTRTIFARSLIPTAFAHPHSAHCTPAACASRTSPAHLRISASAPRADYTPPFGSRIVSRATLTLATDWHAACLVTRHSLFSAHCLTYTAHLAHARRTGPRRPSLHTSFHLRVRAHLAVLT